MLNFFSLVAFRIYTTQGRNLDPRNMILNRMREPWIAALHSRPQTWDLFGQRHGSRALAGVRKQEFRLSAQPQKFETITVTIRLQKWPAVALARYPGPRQSILVPRGRDPCGQRIRGAGQKDRSSGDENGGS